MTAPRWIVEAFEVMMAGPGVGDPEVDKLAAALLERLPLEAMGAALALPIARLRDVVHRLRETGERAPDVRAVPMRLVHQSAFDELIAYVGSGDCGRLDEVVRALAADHDVVTIAELYQGASKALDAAGVPYAVNTAEVYRPLDLAGRIRWLAEQRPTRLELQRVEARVDAELAAKQKAIDDAAPIMAELVVATRTAEQQRDSARSQLATLSDMFTKVSRERDVQATELDAIARQTDGAEMDRTLPLPVQVQRRMAELSHARRLELDATRRMAAAAADDLDRERRDHQDAMGDAAATELRLQTTIGANAQELDLLRRQISDLQDQAEEHATREDEREAAHEHETGDLRRRFDDLQRDRDRLARDLNQIQGDLDTAERKLRDAKRDLGSA